MPYPFQQGLRLGEYSRKLKIITCVTNGKSILSTLKSLIDSEYERLLTSDKQKVEEISAGLENEKSTPDT